MAEPFIGEIRLMAIDFAPREWAMCNGQLMPINQNQALYALLGTQFGGDGRVNFALPNLQGRVPIHAGAGRIVGTSGGAQAHTVSIAELPTHTHIMRATTDNANTSIPAADVFFGTAALDVYRAPTGAIGMRTEAVSSVGGSQAHLNMQPFLTLNFCIALIGIFPSPN